MSSGSTGSNDSSCTNALPQIDTTKGAAPLPSTVASTDIASPDAAASPSPAASPDNASPGTGISPGTAASPGPAASPDDASPGTAASPSPAVPLSPARPAPSTRNQPAAVASEGAHHQYTAATDKSMLTMDSSAVLGPIVTSPDAHAVPTRDGVSTGGKPTLATGQTPGT